MNSNLTPKEKEFTILMVIVGVVIILWYWWEKRNAANAMTAPAPETDFSNWPMDTPADYAPQSLDGLTLNIPNQMPSLLSDQYIPLFGFIGMAQGTYFH